MLPPGRRARRSSSTPTRAAAASLTDAAAQVAATLAAATPPPAQQLPHFGTHALEGVLAAPGLAPLSSAARALSSAAASASAAASSLASPLADLTSMKAAAAAGAHFGRDAVVGVGAWVASSSPPALPRLPLLPSFPADPLAALAEAWEGAAANGIGPTHAPLVTVLAAAAAAAALAAASAARAGPADPNPPALPPTYSPEANGAYWARRPVSVAARALTLLTEVSGWGAALASDFARGPEVVRANAPARAAAARAVLERLGPAYIKVAQAVSTRVDVLSEPYLLEIERLTDRVPVFPTETARAAMAAAWGVEAPEVVLSSIGAAPIAAASLGQVYRATLRDGGDDVAVKVQRPGVAEAVSLDLLIMRWMAGVVSSRPGVNTDWVALIDEWAGRFWSELDYRLEAATASAVARQLEGVAGVLIPAPYPSLTTAGILVTEFVVGERLADSAAGDVRELCSTLLNVYLYMLLEGGILHGDPHPGNLLYSNGRAVILDWGLVTDIPPETSLNLLSYITHLSLQDWDGVARDLVGLGFIPEGAPDPVESGVAKPLGAILRQLSAGGGAKGLDIKAISAELEDLTSKYPFQIPAYFALILRAFSTIEGIALRADPTYSIVGECFPYLARRLLTDDHPRAAASLRELLYGDGEGGRVNVKRLTRLAGGFAAFTTDGVAQEGGSAAVGGGGGGARPAATAAALVPAPTSSPSTARSLVDPAVLDLATAALAKPGPVQDVLVEEAAAVAGALRRAGAARLARIVAGPVGGGVRTALSKEDTAALAMLSDLADLGREAAAGAFAAARAAPRPNPASAVATLRKTFAEVRPYAPALATGAVRTLARVIARSED